MLNAHPESVLLFDLLFVRREVESIRETGHGVICRIQHPEGDYDCGEKERLPALESYLQELEGRWSAALAPRCRTE